MSAARLCSFALLALGACSSSTTSSSEVVDVEVSPIAATAEASARALPTAAASASAGPITRTPTAEAIAVPLPAMSAIPSTNASQVPATLHPQLSVELAAHAKSAAPGMTALSPAQVAEFDPGEVLVTSLQIDPGRCYTVLASIDGIQRLELSLVVAPPMSTFPPMPVAVAVGTPPNVALGAGSSCFKNPMPIPMPASVVVTAAAGKGAAAVQVWSK